MVDVFSDAIVARFWGKVLRQSGDAGHWFWVGAIADDGYGRFSINHDGRTDVVRPHRYSYALAHNNIELASFGQLMHVCDIPLCVRASDDELTHLVPGDTRVNMLDRQSKRRDDNGSGFRWAGLAKENFARNSRALRSELLEHGVTRPDVLAMLVAGADPEAPTLF